MPNILFFFTLPLLLLLNVANAETINKCTLHGNVTYSDQPCAKNERSTTISSQEMPALSSKSAKQRYQSDKRKLEKIEKQKRKEEKQERRDAQRLAYQQKQHKAHEYQCQQLHLKKEMAKQHYDSMQIKANRKAREKATMQLKAMSNRYEHYCG